MTEDPIEDSNQIIPVNVRNILIVCRYFVTVKISFLQPYKVRTFTTCLAFPPWCSRYTVHNKVAFKTEVTFFQGPT